MIRNSKLPFAFLILTVAFLTANPRALGEFDSPSDRDAMSNAPKPPPDPIGKYGQIIIVGNANVPESMILDCVAIRPGKRISLAEMRSAEKSLCALRLFDVDIHQGNLPAVCLLNQPNDGEHRDVLIMVEEKPDVRQRLRAIACLRLAHSWRICGFPIAVAFCDDQLKYDAEQLLQTARLSLWTQPAPPPYLKSRPKAADDGH